MWFSFAKVRKAVSIGFSSGMWWSCFEVLLGFVLLFYGGGRVCRSASALAVALGVSRFVIGMTLVALSTSAPEFITSLLATIDHHPELVLGNVIGSNLLNIGCAAGLVALICPFSITSRVIEIEMPFLFGVTFVFALLILFSKANLMAGALSLLVGIIYLYRICKADVLETPEAVEAIKISVGSRLISFAVGILGLFLGAHWVVSGSLHMAQMLGWSDTWVGLTIVAFGTSLPEITTSLVAALRGYGSICTGNIVGSNIFNILFVAGTCACLCPLTTSQHCIRCLALPGLIFLTALLWRFFTTKREVSRFEGFLLLAIYLPILYGLHALEVASRENF
ncbi:MAG: calcium/sodium antiporter [Verrucomicrobiota bacterium]|nr:MAG: calcium/sodium antiporter [Verrucomicrobiota bacterium]